MNVLIQDQKPGYTGSFHLPAGKKLYSVENSRTDIPEKPGERNDPADGY